MLATLLLALTLLTNSPVVFTNSPTMHLCLQSSIRSTATAPTPPSVVTEMPVILDPCADEFSSAVRNDIMGRISEGKPSLVLDPYMGDEILIFRLRGYCRELDEVGKAQTPEDISKDIVRDLQTEADNFGFKITYVSKLTKVLNGSSIAIVITPPPDKIAAAGTDFRVLQVFVFNKTRIVGSQFHVTVTGLKTP